MKKIFQLVFVVLIVCMVLEIPCRVAYAEGIPKPSGVKIVIDGRERVYKDTPIVINQRILLPLKEFAADLGVKNDSRHIVWDKDKKSIAILGKGAWILMTAGSTAAEINGVNSVADTAPLVYKNVVYVPMLFVSASLNKKVSWDAEKNTAAISSTGSFQKVKAVIDSARAAGSSVARYKVIEENRTASNNVESPNWSVTSYEVDNDKMIWHEKYSVNNRSTGSTQLLSEHYQIRNLSYTKDSSNIVSGPWKKFAFDDSVLKTYFWRYTPCGASVGVSDLFYTGVSYTEDKNKGKIILEGDVPGPMTGTISPRELELNSRYHTKIVINNKNGLVEDEVYTRYYKDHAGKQIQETRTIRHFDINADFVIAIPENIDDPGYQAGKIIDTPKAQIIIEGVRREYADKPVTINGKILIPFKAVSADIGITGGKIDYVTDDKNQRITVTYNSGEYVLQLGSSLVHTGNSNIELGAAPVNYNGCLYMPLSFFSECLNMKTAWNKELEMAVICSWDQYNRNMRAVTDANTALAAVKKYGLNTVFTSMDINGSTLSLLSTADVVDCLNKVVHRVHSNKNRSKTSLVEIIFEEAFFSGQYSYTRFSRDESQWTKKGLNQEYCNVLYRPYNLYLRDWEATGLVMKTDDGAGEIILEGDTGQGISSTDPNAIFFYHEKIVLDKTSHILKYIEYTITNAKSVSYKSIQTVQFSCLHDDYAIDLPYIAD